MDILEQFAFPYVEMPEAAYGVLTIPSLSVNVPLFQQIGNNGQINIDRENSANLLQYGRNWLIEDHAGSKTGSGVWEMADVKIGMVAFLHTHTKVYKYRCYQITEVENRKFYFAHNGKMVQALSSKDLLTTSCTDREGVQILVAWAYVYEMPV